MTDGPFANPKLGKNLNQLVKALSNDAMTANECTDILNNAVVLEVLNPANIPLLTEIITYVNQDQMNLEPFEDVKKIFKRHAPSAFNDKLEKEILVRLHDCVPIGTAFASALEATVTDYYDRGIRNQIQKEFIQRHDDKQISAKQYKNVRKKINVGFQAANTKDICKAILKDDKNALKAALNKKNGLDEGPSL